MPFNTLDEHIRIKKNAYILRDANKEFVPEVKSEATFMHMSRHKNAGKSPIIKIVNKYYTRVTK
jgi:hypothetical protein